MVTHPRAPINPQLPPQLRPGPVHAASGRVVGEVTPAGILHRRKYVIMRKPPASIGYDEAMIAEAEDRGAITAVNGQRGDDVIYSASVKCIREHGFVGDHGHGVQRFLALRYWDKLYADGHIEPAELPRRPEVEQAELFPGMGAK